LADITTELLNLFPFRFGLSRRVVNLQNVAELFDHKVDV
jgi:hypothetical protein